MTTYFTSDQHFDHAAIIRHCSRPFSNLEEMREEMIRRHNAVVGSDDDVWHLGDFSLNERTVPYVLPRLNGRHYLVAGNHDECHPKWKGNRSAVIRYRQYGFREVYQNTVTMFPPWGETVLCHMPPSDEDCRYPEYRPRLEKLPGVLLHGHVHERYMHRRLWTSDRLDDEHKPRSIDCINVGVDVWNYEPVSLEELAEYIQLNCGAEP